MSQRYGRCGLTRVNQIYAITNFTIKIYHHYSHICNHAITISQLFDTYHYLPFHLIFQKFQTKMPMSSSFIPSSLLFISSVQIQPSLNRCASLPAAEIVWAAPSPTLRTTTATSAFNACSSRSSTRMLWKNIRSFVFFFFIHNVLGFLHHQLRRLRKKKRDTKFMCAHVMNNLCYVIVTCMFR